MKKNSNISIINDMNLSLVGSIMYKSPLVT